MDVMQFHTVNSRRLHRFFFFPALVLNAFTVCASAVPADSTGAFTSSNLPIVVIDTRGQYIPDEPKITAHMGIVDNGPGLRNLVTGPFNGYDGTIGIETRGSSSEQYPKKQYAVETRDSAGNDADASLLGLPAQSDWVLSAPYSDKSLMRDALLYALARSMGRYASRARFCEVVLNGQYVGVYVLFEKIKRDKNRVNISKMTAADTSGDGVTGGYIIKIDKIEGASTQGWNSNFPPYPGAPQRVLYQYHYPKFEDLTWPQRAFITSWMRDFEIAMYLPSFNDPVAGYPGRLDVGAFVDFVLLNEFSRNVDGFRLSCFMYKDRESKGGKLVMGPVWDFNFAFGNADYHGAWRPEGFHLQYMSDSAEFRTGDPYQPPFWWKKIFMDPLLAGQLGERWVSLRRDRLSSSRIESVIDSISSLLGEAQQRNFVRWPILGKYIWPNPYVGKTYQEEISYLKTWIGRRVAWLDQQWVSTTEVGEEGEGGLPGRVRLEQNYPNPFNPATTVEFRLQNSEPIILKVYDVLGREVAVLVNEVKRPGTYTVSFDGSHLASGVYYYRLTSGRFAETRKMLLLR